MNSGLAWQRLCNPNDVFGVTCQVDKSSDAFRTISEVASDLDLPQHVLRFWETRFAQIKPLKRGGGRRYYRPDDVDLLKGIRHLLYGEGYTIKGVQRILKEQGVRFVMGLWQDGAPALDPAMRGAHTDDHDAIDFGESTAPLHGSRHDIGYGEHGSDFEDHEPMEPIDLPLTPLRLSRGEDPRGAGQAGGSHSSLDRAREAAISASRTVSLVPTKSPHAGGRDGETSGDGDPMSPESIAHRFAPTGSTGQSSSSQQRKPVREGGQVTEWGPDTRQGLAAQAPRPMLDRLKGVATGGLKQDMQTRPPTPPTAQSWPGGEGGSGHGLSRDDVRRLQATLFELLECKRLLDQTR